MVTHSIPRSDASGSSGASQAPCGGAEDGRLNTVSDGNEFPGPLPRISLVTPVFNGAAHIRETIESVLVQDYPNLEYIIVDGGSTDDTLRIVREYEARLARIISEPDRGMYDAVAKGFDSATGDVFAYINADDVFEPGALIRIGEYFRDNPKAMVSYRDCTVTVDGWRFPNRCQPLVDFPDLLRGHILNQEGIQFRREAYLAVGGVSRDLRLAGDYDLWLRFSRRFRLHRTTGHVGSFRVRPGQLSQDMKAYRAEQTVSQNRVRSSWSSLEFLPQVPRYALNRVLRLWERIWGRPRFYYPFSFNGPIAPAQAPDPTAPPARCPLTGRPPEILLFSTRDTRFGDSRLNYLYYCSSSHMAVAWPPRRMQELAELRSQNNRRMADVIEPPEGCVSPYRRYRPRRKWRRLPLKLRIPQRIAKIINRSEKSDWKAACISDLDAVLGGHFRHTDKDVHFLYVGADGAEFLEAVQDNTCWQSSRIDIGALIAKEGSDGGRDSSHDPSAVGVGDSGSMRLYEIIYLDQSIQLCADPIAVLRKVRCMLAERGVVVITTPNLDSCQVDLFGPTWAHWHAPFNRMIFSRRAIRRLGELAGMRECRALTRSHTKWTALSIELNKLGVAGAVSDRFTPAPRVLRRARSLAAWSRLLWNWRGRGDYLVVVFELSKHQLYSGE